MKRFIIFIFFISAAFVSMAADTVSYRLSKLENWAFYGTDKPVIELVAINGRGVDEVLDLHCHILDHEGTPIYELAQRGIVPQRDSLRLSFSFKTMAPGFYNALLCSGERVVKGVNVAYEPEKIVWADTVAGQWQGMGADFGKLVNIIPLGRRDFDPGFRMLRSKELSGKEKNVYEFEMLSYDGEKVCGYMAFPKGKKGLDAMLTLVAAEERSANPLADFTAPVQMAELVLYIAGRGENEEYYKNFLTDMLLGVDFLAQRPEVNRNGIYVQGEGKAGAFAFVVSAIDDRVAASFVAAPDFCGFVEDFNVESIASGVSAPVLLGLGLQENTKRLQAGFALYNAAATVKEYFIFPDNETVDRKKWRYIRDTFIIRRAIFKGNPR